MKYIKVAYIKEQICHVRIFCKYEHRSDLFKTSSDKKYQIELTIDEYDVKRSNKTIIKVGVATTTNYVFLIERNDSDYSAPHDKKIKVACKDIDVKFDDAEQKILIMHRDEHEKEDGKARNSGLLFY